MSPRRDCDGAFDGVVGLTRLPPTRVSKEDQDCQDGGRSARSGSGAEESIIWSLCVTHEFGDMNLSDCFVNLYCLESVCKFLCSISLKVLFRVIHTNIWYHHRSW